MSAESNSFASIVSSLKLTIGGLAFPRIIKSIKYYFRWQCIKTPTNLKILQRIRPRGRIASKKVLTGLAARERGFTSITKITNLQSVMI